MPSQKICVCNLDCELAAIPKAQLSYGCLENKTTMGRCSSGDPIRTVAKEAQSTTSLSNVGGSKLATTNGNDDRLNYVESTLKDVLDQLAELGKSDTQDHVPGATTQPPRLTPEASRNLRVARWQETLASHSRQPVDVTWSSTVMPHVEQDMRSVAAKVGAEHVALDCRSTTCTSRMKWKDYDSARKSVKALIGHPYRINCGTEILLPEPTDMAAPYEATLLLNCSEQAQAFSKGEDPLTFGMRR